VYINAKMITVVPGIGVGKIKDSGGGDEFTYNIFDIL
jgi:hypothetical protein